MGQLSQFLVGTPGYFREGEEQTFPWKSTDKSIWYALLVVEDGHIQRYGFTASKSSKAALLMALERSAKLDVLLLGVWTGNYSTHLFVLKPSIAIEKLRSL